MSLDIDKTASELLRDKLVDHGRMKPGGRSEVHSAIDRWRQRHGLRAYVLVLPSREGRVGREGREGREGLHEARALWETLKLDDKFDLLLVTDGQAWEARGWGLSAQQLEQGLDASTPALKQYLGRGLTRALDEFGGVAIAARHGSTSPSAAAGAKTPGPADKRASTSSSSSSLPLIGLTAGGALLLGGVGFIVHRRNKLAKERRAEFDDARATADQAFTEVVLACEELAGDEARELQLRAGELKRHLDAHVAQADGNERKMSDPVVLGRIRQYQSELAALRSTALQKAREVSCSNQESLSTSPAQKPNEEWDPSNGSSLYLEPSSTSAAARKS